MTVGTEQFNEEGYVDIPITADNCLGVAGMRFLIDYDCTVMELVEVTSDDQQIRQHIASNIEDGDRIDTVVTWYDSQNRILDGEVMTLRFKLHQGIENSSSSIMLHIEENDICSELLENVPVECAGGMTVSEGAAYMMNETVEEDQDTFVIGFDFYCIDSGDTMTAVAACYDDAGKMVDSRWLERAYKSGHVQLDMAKPQGYASCKVILLKDNAPVCTALYLLE